MTLTNSQKTTELCCPEVLLQMVIVITSSGLNTKLNNLHHRQYLSRIYLLKYIYHARSLDQATEIKQSDPVSSTKCLVLPKTILFIGLVSPCKNILGNSLYFLSLFFKSYWGADKVGVISLIKCIRHCIIVVYG